MGGKLNFSFHTFTDTTHSLLQCCLPPSTYSPSSPPFSSVVDRVPNNQAFAYQAYYGLFVCPWYAYGQTMIAEVTPKGSEFLFFSLFSIIGKTSAFIGPFVTQAIADDTGNASTPFYFLLALSLGSCVLLWPLDIKKSKIEQARFIEHDARDKNLAKSDIVTPQTFADVVA